MTFRSFCSRVEAGDVVGFLKIIVTMTGKIKTLTDRGFGFIARDGETKDLFFHSKDLSGITYDELKVGDMVSFEVVDGPKGPSAKNVTLA